MEQDPPPPPFAVVFAEFLEHVRTTEDPHQCSSDLEDILQEHEQHEPDEARDNYLDQYAQALANNEDLEYFLFHFTRFTDICFLEKLHSHIRLRSIRLKFDPREDYDSYHYEDLDDDTSQDVEIENTIARFVGLKKLDIRTHFVHGAPRWMQALLRGISQNSSLRGLGMFNMDDFGLQELDWTKSKLQKLHIEECEFSFSTWKSLLSIPSLESLELATLLGGDHEEPGRIPRHVMTRNHIFRSLPAQCRSIRNLVILWQETGIWDVESLIRFFEFERLTLDLRGLEWGNEQPVQPPEDYHHNFSRICGLIHPANSKVHFVFDSRTTSTTLSGCFPLLLRTILGFPAVVGMEIVLHDPQDEIFNQPSSQCLRILVENGEHLERLDMSGIVAQHDDICKIITNLPRLQYLRAYFHPTPTIAEAVDAHPNLLQFDFELTGRASARDRIETTLCRNRASRFARRIASRTTCSETGASLKLWPTIFSNVDTDNVAAVSGVFQAFRNDIGRLLVQELQEQPPSEKMAASRKRSREGEAEK